MLREITLGQYYPVDSAVHRLDPRTKLFGTMVFIISLFISIKPDFTICIIPKSFLYHSRKLFGYYFS